MDFQRNPTIAELKAIDPSSSTAFTLIALLRKVQNRLARNGSPFLTVEVGDATGHFTFTCFENTPAFALLSGALEGSILSVSGHTEYYQDRFSPRVQQVQIIPEEEAERDNLMAQLVESAPLPAETMWEELISMIDSISHEKLRETVHLSLKEAGEVFKTVPAAISMHHAYRHGLLEHTLNVCRNAKTLLPLYPEINPDLAIAGAIVHDLGKTIEYVEGTTTKKSRTGLLQGHVVLGYRIVRRAAMTARLDHDLLERLEHIVLSHQGELEWGAAVMAATPEAVFVSMLDNLDAKMGMVQRVLRNASEDAEFSDYLPGLKSSVLLTSIDPQSLSD